jgi:hypothetical protein
MLEKERKREIKKRERMLARVRTPSSPVRERDRHKERHRQTLRETQTDRQADR